MTEPDMNRVREALNRVEDMLGATVDADNMPVECIRDLLTIAEAHSHVIEHCRVISREDFDWLMKLAAAHLQHVRFNVRDGDLVAGSSLERLDRLRKASDQ